jgi:molecular chaperone GrpE
MNTSHEEGNEEQQEPLETTQKEEAGNGNPTMEEAVTDASELKKALDKINELNDKYLRLYADFDNYKRRSAKERLEQMQTAGKDVIIPLLEVMDDCDRAESMLAKATDVASVKEGIGLIFLKLRNTLQARGLKNMECKGKPFDTDLHEAITEIPAGNDEMVGKVIDELEKGYYLNDKIIRFAKVVVGK